MCLRYLLVCPFVWFVELVVLCVCWCIVVLPFVFATLCVCDGCVGV